jgi:serine/threonine-protein kinase RsbT
MNPTRRERHEIKDQEQVVRARQIVRQWSAELGFSLVDQTKIVTAASELARNTLIHAGGGSMEISVVEAGPRRGLKLTFTDQGPGIADVEQAMSDGFTTGSGLGLGLGGSRRLVNDFRIESRLGEGTTVEVTRWK